jgi:ribose transport system permease protein
MVGATRLFGVIPFSGIVAMIITVLFWFIMKYTKIGRCAYAIGGNKEAARASGINTFLYKILFNALMGFTVGVASLVQIGRIYSANPVMGSGQELQVIAMVIIGGTNLNGGEGNIGGTVIGALIMGIIANGLNLLNVSSFWQQFFIGAIIVLVVVIDQLKHKKN